MLDEKLILTTVIEYNRIKEKADSVARKHIEIAKGKLPINFDLKSIDMDTEDIRITYETGCRGSYDIEYYRLPISCLWEDNWEAALLVELEAQKKLKETKEAEAVQKRELDRVEAEKATLLMLKEKYPNV